MYWGKMRIERKRMKKQKESSLWRDAAEKILFLFENAEHAAALVRFWFKHQNRTFGAIKSFKGPVSIQGTFTQDQFCSQHDHIWDAVGGVETVDQKINGPSAHFI